jgi:hypothetical protein
MVKFFLLSVITLVGGCAHVACLPPEERAERDSGKHGIVLECVPRDGNMTVCTYSQGPGQMHVVQAYRNCR